MWVVKFRRVVECRQGSARCGGVGEVRCVVKIGVKVVEIGGLKGKKR